MEGGPDSAAVLIGRIMGLARSFICLSVCLFRSVSTEKQTSNLSKAHEMRESL